MPVSAPIQTQFNSGELSPLMYGRLDFPKYKNGLATCLNHIPFVQGPVTRRPGTIYVNNVKNSAARVRLVKFEFSTQQAYVLEFGNLYCRVFLNHGQGVNAQNVTGAANNGSGLIRLAVASTAGMFTGNTMTVKNVVGTTEANGTWIVTVIDSTHVDLQGSAFVHAYVSGGTTSTFIEFPTPYLSADLQSLNFTQSADTLYIAHNNYPPATITRNSGVSFSQQVLTFVDGPYLDPNTTSTTLTPSGTTGSITVTASSTTGINNGAGFSAGDVGRAIRFQTSGAGWSYGTITAVGSTTSVTVNIGAAGTSAATTATTTWRLGVFTTGSYPACVTFYQDRLCWGGPQLMPTSLFLSFTGNYLSHAPTAQDTAATVADDNALDVTLDSNDVQTVRWMSGDANGLLVGTNAGEWALTPSTLGGALTPSNLNAVQMTAYGEAPVQPIRCGYTTLALQRSRRKIREYTFVYYENRYHAPDLTVISQHITLGGIEELAYQQEPNSILWLVRSDGTLVGFTYERDQQVVAWHRHTLGGVSDANGTPAIVESVCCIPAPDGTRDEVWLSVQRYINGQTVRSIEYMTKIWEDGDSQVTCNYYDMASQYAGSPTKTITGLTYAPGETLSLILDGAAHPDVVVSNDGTGTIHLTRTGSNASIGYKYNSDGATMRGDSGAATGTAQAKTKRIHRCAFRVLDTLGLQVGKDFDSLVERIVRTGANNLGQFVPLFTGDDDDTWEGDYDLDDPVVWRFNGGFPGTMVAIMPKEVTQDRA